ncbi:endoribonuclease L-PSP [Sinobacterium caligoides]|uniref:Endoribonuclease L-PSP n=1 Tax=Sinobacterium caligoides TaxID=933926 RepID=A0A3N2DMM8_9GAMM|nr:Rid family hydrolase [Sinobacterium caligoides]ROS01064.1 endoribonuclease L-PSP [Sinobacterium caligoides]
MIERKQGQYEGRNKSSAYKDLVWTVATSSDKSVGIEKQTEITLEIIQKNLLELGSNKNRIVSAQVYIAKMADKAKMDAIWCKWLGTDPECWPQRACLGVDLDGDDLIEVTVTAVRG